MDELYDQAVVLYTNAQEQTEYEEAERAFETVLQQFESYQQTCSPTLEDKVFMALANWQMSTCGMITGNRISALRGIEEFSQITTEIVEMDDSFLPLKLSVETLVSYCMHVVLIDGEREEGIHACKMATDTAEKLLEIEDTQETKDYIENVKKRCKEIEDFFWPEPKEEPVSNHAGGCEYCISCGNMLTEEMVFCPKCGTKKQSAISKEVL